MHHDESASLLAKVSEELAGERDQLVTTARICQLAVEVVDGCDHATIALRSRGSAVQTAAASAGLARTADELQLRHGEGPILGTALNEEVCRSNDVAADARWPTWGPLAAELGLRSLVSVQLSSGHQVLGP